LSIPVKEFLRLGPASVLDLKKADGESFEVAISALVRGLLKKRPP
jgi:flagellar motor switch/type III secretory pathway protein FliN